MKEIFEQALKGRAFECAVISTEAINFSPELLKACESNVCGNYNKSWTCPPAAGSLEEQKEKILAFAGAFVFTTKFGLEDSFDYEGMMKAKDYHNKLTGEMHELFGKTNPVFGAGSCKICRTCAYPEPCRFPEKTFTSIEAAGINVTELSKAGGIRYNNGENTVTYFSMILFDERRRPSAK
jgi:predicted metal-binding protein